MDELTTKILLVILGFLFGVSAQIIVGVNMKNRKKVAIRDLMRTEVETFTKACEDAAMRKCWDSSMVKNVSSLIIQCYSNNPDRLLAVSKRSARQGLYDFYFEVNGILSLIEMHRNANDFDKDGSSSAIGPGTYEGLVKRSRTILETLQ
jgi:hypothetical protein